MLKNIGSNWVLIVVTMAAMYVLTPFIIHALGQDGYGTWTLITALTGYVSLLALGVPMASVRYLAQDAAEHDATKMNRTIGTCLVLYLLIGGAALLIGAVLSVFFALVFKVPAVLQGEALVAFGLMVIQVSAGFIGILPEGIMFAHHDFVVRNVIRVAGVVLRLCLTVAALTFNPSLIALASVQLVFLACDFGVSWLLVRRRYPGVRLNIRDFDRGMLRRIFSFSLYVLVLNAGARLVFETDALVIGAFLDVGSIPFYVVANSLIIYVMDFVIAIAAVVSPMATKLNTEGRLDELREMFLKWSKVALSLSVVAGVFLIVLGPAFLGVWIDPTFERPSGVVLQILMWSGLVFLPVRGVAIPVLMGMGKIRIPTIAFLITGVLNVGLSIALVGPFGLAGVALGTAIPNVVYAVVMLVVACRELGVAPSAYVKYVAARVVIGVIPMLLWMQWWKVRVPVHSLASLAAAGASMVVLFAITWVWFVYRDDPYVDLRAHFAGRGWRWSRA